MTLCSVCGEQGGKKCSRCKSIFYCSVEHQRQHWREHKKLCGVARQRSPLTMSLEKDAKRFGLRPVLKLGSLLEVFSDCLGEVLTDDTKKVISQKANKDVDDIYKEILPQERHFLQMFEVSFFSTLLPRSVVECIVSLRVMDLAQSAVLQEWIAGLKTSDKDEEYITMIWLLWRFLYHVCNTALQNFSTFKLLIRCQNDQHDQNDEEGNESKREDIRNKEVSLLHYEWVEGTSRVDLDPEVVGFTASSTIGWLKCDGNHSYPCTADDCGLPVLERALLKKVRNTPLWNLEPSKNTSFNAANLGNGKLGDVIWPNGSSSKSHEPNNTEDAKSTMEV